MIYRFMFWKEWVDGKGRMWAEPYWFDTAADARRAHNGAKSFAWAGEKERPSVTDLYSIGYSEDPTTGKKREQQRTTIQEGEVRGYREAALSGLREADERDKVLDALGKARAGKTADSSDTPF